jgi:hypothetical protein
MVAVLNEGGICSKTISVVIKPGVIHGTREMPKFHGLMGGQRSHVAREEAPVAVWLAVVAPFLRRPAELAIDADG